MEAKRLDFCSNIATAPNNILETKYKKSLFVVYLVVSGGSFGLHSVADALRIETKSSASLRMDPRPIVALVIVFDSN